MSWQTAIGAHAPGPNDPRGLQPARQLLPVPQFPHSEQHGTLSGQALVAPQVPLNTTGAEVAVEVGAEVIVELALPETPEVLEVGVAPVSPLITVPTPQGVGSPPGWADMDGGTYGKQRERPKLDVRRPAW